MSFAPVKRQKAKLRMALTGVSGAGKTLGALYIAYGITGDWGKIALIDTEHGRARFYADRTDLGIGSFLYSELTPPFSPERYAQMAIEGAKAIGENGVLIVDSMSHAWNAEGGVLDIKERIAAQTGKNSYTAWNEAGQEQNKLINTLFALPCHTITTMRVKTAYALETNDKGKQQPVKLGLTPVQREDTEYEFDTVLEIDREHIARASKDVTFLDRLGQVITPELGKQIGDWLNNGVEPEKCAMCGRTVVPAQGKSVEEIIAGAVKYSGRKMCMDCFGKWYQFNRGRQAQLDKVFAEMGYPAENHDAMIQALLQQAGVETGYPGDADDKQFAQVLKEMRGEA